ncbi:MAG TPA: hypothetical protein VGH57_11565, partial [Amycolatopsis sp.]
SSSPPATRTRRGQPLLQRAGSPCSPGRWRPLRQITASPREIGDIVKAASVLTHFDHGRLT